MFPFLRKLAWFFTRSRREADLRAELEFHLEQETAERGTRHAARRDIGNVTSIAENTRDAWGWARLEHLTRDIAFGVRQLRANPAFSAIAIATLALGIGGVTAMFSAFDAVLIRPLPYTDADRLVMIWNNMGKADVTNKHNATPPEWIEWRRLHTVFTDLAATQNGSATLSADGGAPEQIEARKASWNLWSVLGVRPMLGRVFTEDEDNRGVRVMMISHGLWQRRYGGSPSIIGRKVTMNDEPWEIIGVLPPGFFFMPRRDIEIWMPTSFPAWMRRNFTWHDLHVVARLKPGVSIEQARSSMHALSLQVTAKDFRGPHSVFLYPLREDMTGRMQTALALLLSAAGALLLIACANLANLLLSRGASRGREVALRVALGAGRSRLISQFLTESLVLALLGALAGLALALPAMRFLETLVPETMSAVHLTLDWRVLTVCAAAAIAATLFFGLVPALRASRLDPQQGLREGGGGRNASASRSHHWFQHSLIVAETALAVVLLTCGGMLLQTFQHLRNTDLGIRSEKLLTFDLTLFRYPEFDRRVAFINAQVEAVRTIPGVISAGAINKVPFTNFAEATFYRLEGQEGKSVAGQVALQRNVSQGYFDTVGARLREGRFFLPTDRKTDLRVAIVDETFADRTYPGRSALGQRIQFGATGPKGYWFTIIGVLKSVRESGVLENPRPAVYRVQEQCEQMFSGKSTGIVIRTAVEPASIIQAARKAVASVDPNQPLAHVQTMDEIIERQMSTPTQSTLLLSAFALLALLLASIGLYGVLSYSVTQRTREIGLRMALGATSSEIIGAFGKRGLALTAAGLVIGLILSLFASRSLTALLYGFEPAVVPTVAGVSVILLAVATLACFVPARRASQVDPVVALRNE